MIVTLFLGSLLLVGAWEFWRPWRRLECPPLRRRLANITVWLVNVVLAAILLGSPSTARHLLRPPIAVHLPSWPFADAAVSFIAGFLLLDLIAYSLHRCQHAVPFLWRFHALHHSDPDVDVTTSVRHHPLEYVIASAIYWVAMLVLDIPASVATAHGLVVFAAAAVTHGNVTLPKWLEQSFQPVIITIDLHLIHHSIAYADANSNFGAVLSIWDRLFGTFVQASPSRRDALIFGIPEGTADVAKAISGSKGSAE